MNGRTNSNGVGTDTLQIPLDPPVNLTATAGNAKVSLTWVDPVDKYATPEGETAQDPQQLVSEWDYTVVVRKVGSQPNDPNDGTVVTKSSIRNQYQTSPYEDTGLINDTVYFYGVFAVNKDGVASDGMYDSAVPVATYPVSEVSVGSIINIHENGAYVEYIVVNQGKNIDEDEYDSSCNGTWVIRKNLESLQPFGYRENQNRSFYYNTSDVAAYVNNTFINVFTEPIKNDIKTIKIPYGFPHGTGSYQCKICIPSIGEIGGLPAPSSGGPSTRQNVGLLSYFEEGDNSTANTKRKAIYDGDGRAREYWTRDVINSGSSMQAYTMKADGSGYSYEFIPVEGSGSVEAGVRPMFILSSLAKVDYNLNLIPN